MKLKWGLMLSDVAGLKPIHCKAGGGDIVKGGNTSCHCHNLEGFLSPPVPQLTAGRGFYVTHQSCGWPLQEQARLE